MSNSVRMGRRIATSLLLALAACGREPASSGAAAKPSSAAPAPAVSAQAAEARNLPALPGVAAGQRDWAWRDVVANPLPDEAPAASELLALQPAAARMDALADLAAAKDPRALATLMAALRDPQEAVAIQAAGLLAETHLLAALPRLVLGIGPYPIDYDISPAVRAADASALARLGSPAGIPFILIVLAEGTPLQWADNLLPWTRSPRVAFLQEQALPGLVTLAGTDFGFVIGGPVPAREAAVKAATAWWQQHRAELWEHAPVDDAGLKTRVQLVMDHLDAYQLREIDAARFLLSNLGPGGLPLIEPGLAHPDKLPRFHVLEIFERMADDSTPKTRVRLASLAARPLLSDPAPEVAVQAARVCGAMKVADQLVVALQQRREPDVLDAVLDALGKTGLPAARQALDLFAASSRAAELSADGKVALQAALLAVDPTRDAGAFVALLASPDNDLAFAALQRLITLTGSSCGVDPLKPPAEREPALAAARRALAERRAP